MFNPVGIHILWAKSIFVEQKTPQDPPQTRFRGQQGSTNLTKSFHFSIPQREGVFANSCVQSFVALEAWLMLSLSLCFDSLAVRADSQSLTLVCKTQNSTEPQDTHISKHTAHTLHSPYSVQSSLSMPPFSLFSIHTPTINHISSQRAPKQFYRAQTGTQTLQLS